MYEMTVYEQAAVELGVAAQGLALLRHLAEEAGMPPSDELYDISNYVLPLPAEAWEAEEMPIVAAINWAATPGHPHQVAALVSLRQAFGLPALV